MSIDAINGAWLKDVRPASKKLVLLCLANMHNGQTGQLNPSISTVAKFCGISEKQARRQIHELEVEGIVEVIGNHHGGNQHSTRRYKLNLGESVYTPPVDGSPPADGSPPLPPLGAHPSRPCPLPLPPEGAKPEVTRKKPEGNRNVERERSTPMPFPSDVDKQVWADFMKIRKAKKAPMTEIALKAIRRGAEKAGLSLDEALTKCIEWTWLTFEADWYFKRIGDGQGGTVNKQEELERSNQEVANRFIEKLEKEGKFGPRPINKQGLYAGAARAIFDGADHV